MTEIILKYNPYKVESTITIDGENIKEDSYLSKYKNERLQVWIENLIPKIIEQLNETQLKLVFNGTKLDYEDVLYYCDYYNKNGYNGEEVNIELDYIQANESSDRLNQLKELVKDMREGPFEELKSEEVERNFNKAINSEFEIAVIATMSSGKSTLINSMLSQELMPSKNTACTAKITRIKDNDNLDKFRAVCKNINEEVVATIDDVDIENMKDFNDNKEISFINLEGNIEKFSSEDMNLVLIDTPGPNNSQDSSHAEFTYKVIKDQDSKPIVLYVLNGTQLGINDDSHLLSQVAESMKVGGKQSKDRFIFAVNKIDTINSSKESITSILDNVKKYLEKHGIENPNIYPVSAEIARLIRLNKKGYNLDFQEDLMLGYHKLFLQDENLHTLKYTPLGANIKSEMQSKIDSCEDYYEKALYHTGVPYLEASINTYLNKYALASKITEAVNSFISIIEEKQILKEIEENIQENQEYRKSILEYINYINDELKKGDRAKVVKGEIEKLTFNKREVIQPTLEKINEKSNELGEKFSRKEKFEEHEANIMIDKLLEELKILEADIKTDLDNAMKITIKNNAEEYIEQYKKQVEGLVNTNIKFESKSLNYLTCSIPDTNKLIESYKYTVEEEIGEETYTNPDVKLFNPFTWFQPWILTKKIYEEKTYIDVNILSENVMDPYFMSLYKNIENFEIALDNETKNLKKFFKNEVDKLEEVLQNKVYELEVLLKQSNKLEENIESKNKEKEWLVQISNRLESILDI